MSPVLLKNKLEVFDAGPVFFYNMTTLKEAVEKLDDLELQKAFTKILVTWGTLYAEMEKRGLFINPAEKRNIFHISASLARYLQLVEKKKH